ncbi:hypothetical protein D8B26_005983 [Coccidioides posadasii str. Silveira]|uniref:Uncharacterized protein n=3 Tax=Coccidioides posadasii TaxID=199306 RepID=E9DI35_COCPS|nr:BRCA1 C Terminus (BRCT) domain containing protein [Coccidioides posadasii C735 delta SOWgp]EER27900.1 BRCA1 C Terminus (BRCT) domain containing protein [Coccidioides posadasii C735 delta SOWgp]EFW13831.1 conserved hypothetical protein [Coccidioides posadasii str. Silveira]KMM67865.1 BRCT domain-containing protein [Coccidioides posadasii RMSCC 3488]QVM11331.1 hypothetical protein D8B26_005983 [Coccidioides posadasii str. Silveira]|eukprot:XP_003070045.1 BRCA1 C Terminus (BRCT) domain containing protein [Coccidioides posadasii C735 delta SOWgp]
MGKSFHKVTVCIAGNFGAQNDKIKQWVEVNGGTFSKKVTADVTHLIATEPAVRKNVPEVRAAKRIKGIKIVSYEWLEDSLLSKSKRPKREAPYLLTAKMEAGRKKARAQKNKGKDGNTTRQLSELDGYHPYTDNTGHRYSAILVRPGPLPRRKERHVLKIFESDSVPHTYATLVKYTRIGRSASDFLAPPGSTFDVAVRAFNKFFKAKSGINWDQRDRKPPLKTTEEGAKVPPDEGWFEYMPEKSSSTAAPKYDEETATAATVAMLQDAINEMESSEARGLVTGDP